MLRETQGPVGDNGAFFFLYKHSFTLALATAAWLATCQAGATQYLPATVFRFTVVLAIAAAARTWTLATLPSPLLCWACALACAAAVWGCVLSDNLWLALQPATNAWLVVLVYIALVMAPPRTADIFLYTGGAMAVGHALWAIAQWLGGETRARGGFFNPNDMAAFLAPCAILAFDTMRQRRQRVLGIAGCILMLAVLASGSRAGTLALAAGTAVLLATWLRRHPMAWVGFAMLVALALWLLRARWLTAMDPFAYSRVDIWQASLRVFERAWWGIGLGSYADVMRVEGVPLTGWVRYPALATNAHNEVLQALVECGLLGGIAALVAPVALAADVISHGGRRRDVAVLAAFALPALTTATLHVPPVAFLAAAWAAAATTRTPSPGPMSQRPWRVAIVGLACGAWLLSLPASLSTVAMQYAARERDAHRRAAALSWAQFAEQANPGSAGAALLTASLNYALDQDAVRAADTLMEIAERFRHDPMAPQRAAEVLAKHSHTPQQWGLVAHLFEMSAQRDPHNALVWCSAAVAHQQAGNMTARTLAYQRALSEEPHCARALAALARISADAGDIEQASTYRAAHDAAVLQAEHVRGYLAAVLSDP